MFGWTITFLLTAIIAGIFGFSGLAGTGARIAQVIALLSLALFLILVWRSMSFSESRRYARKHPAEPDTSPTNRSPASRAAVAARQQKGA